MIFGYFQGTLLTYLLLFPVNKIPVVGQFRSSSFPKLQENRCCRRKKEFIMLLIDFDLYRTEMVTHWGHSTCTDILSESADMFKVHYENRTQPSHPFALVEVKQSGSNKKRLYLYSFQPLNCSFFCWKAFQTKPLVSRFLSGVIVFQCVRIYWDFSCKSQKWWWFFCCKDLHVPCMSHILHQKKNF